GSLISVSGGHSTGTIAFHTGTLASSNGGGLVFDNADGTYSLNGTTTLNGGTSGLSITNGSGGTVAIGNVASIGQTTSVNGVAVTVSDSTATLNFDVDVKQTNNFAILDVANHSGGTLNFQVTASLNATAGTGLQFSNADGTYNMNSANTLNGGDAGIDIDSGSAGTFAFINNTVITSPTGAAFTVSDSTAAITYGGSITQANNAALLDVTNHSGGTISFNTPGTLTASNGTGLQFSNADGTYNFNGTATIGNAASGDAGIDIDTGSDGAFTFGANVTLIGASGTTFLVDGGGGNITVNGTITDDTGQLVRITNRTGGTVDFNALVSDNFDGDGGINQAEGSVHLGGNTAGTVRFDGGLVLSTGTNDGLTSLNSAGSTATLVITDPAGSTANKIATTTGQAIDIQNTTIGAGGLVFESINVNGAGVGINLNTTGSTAGLSVTGTGAAGTGGTIQETGQGATFTSTSNVVLTNMNFTNANKDEGTVNNVDSSASNSGAKAAINMSNVSTATFTGLNLNGNGGTGGVQLGINGNVVSNFTLANSTISGFGDEAGEGGMRFWNLTGTSSITNSTFSFAAGDTTAGENHIDIRNGSGSLTLALTGNTFNTTRTSGSGSGGLSLTTGGTATATANIVNNDFLGMKTSGVEVFARDTSTLNVNITNGGTAGNHNVFDRQGGLSRAIGLNAEDTANLNFNVTNNTINGSGGPIVNVFGINSANIMGRINANTITGGGAGSAGSAIYVHPEDSAKAIIEVLNNTISQTGNDAGISASSSGDGANGSSDFATLDITIANNNIAITGTGQAGNGSVGIDVRSGANVGDQTKTAAYVHHNTVTLGASGADVAFLTRIGSTTSNLYLQGPIAGADNGTRTNNNWNGNSNTPSNSTFAFDASGAPAYTNPPAGAPYNGAVRTPTNIVVAAPPVVEEPVQPAGGEPAEDPQADNGPAPTLTDSPAPAPEPIQTPAPAPAPAPVPAAPIVIEDGILSRAELDFLVDAAIQRWAAAGATDAQIAAMRSVNVSVSDLAGLTLGQSDPGNIVLDSDAAGWRWFVDSTPGDDSEYSGSGSKLTASNPAGLAGTRIDLLTVLTHELGHQIGLSDLSAPSSRDELMYGTIAAGERRLPGSDDLSGAAGAPVTGAFAFAPITIGSLPAGQKVILEFRHSIDSPAEDGLAGSWTGKTIVDSDQTAPVESSVESGAIDSLTLGDRVFVDSNRNGSYDAGEGVANVSVSLYADTNNSGGWDSGDAQIGTSQLTGAGGLYSFAGLAPGDYIVVVDGSNFASGKPLNGKVSIAGELDSDNNVDNDDNGVAGVAGLGAGVASQTIRLEYGTEPTDDGDTDFDTNLTLDFGFFAPNQAPVIGALNGDSATYYEGGAPISIDVGQNATVTDSDSANFDGGSLTLAVNGSNGDSVVWGPNATFDGSNNVFVGATNVGTLSTAGNQIIVTFNANANAANIQTLIRNFQFAVNGDTPVAGTRTFTFTLVDGDGNDGGLGNDTGTASSTIEVVPVSDAPVGADRAGTGLFDSTGTAYAFTVADFATGFTDPNDSPANSFSAVKITTLPSASVGKIYFDSNLADATPAVAISAGDVFTAQDLTDGKLTFVGAAGSAGQAMSFTFQVIDNGTTDNGGVVMDASPNTFSTTILAGNAAPVVDLDGDDSVASGTGFTSSYAEGGAAAISDTDVKITDGDSGDDVISATITITNFVTGDRLNPGTLPSGVTVDPSSTDKVLKLVAAAGTSAADFEAAIESVQFDNTGNDPTAGGTNTSRTITVVVNDGTSSSAPATATISVTGTNDSPDGTDAAITAVEDSFRILAAGDFGFTDPDSADSMSAVTITAVNGAGQLYYDADG
ncbi:MAG TPA: SdrD B-like domain-containing protein, partial [Allosphingosinicella sp.]